jgi:hypothetical protein
VKNFKICGPYKVNLKTVTNSYWRLNPAQRDLWKETKKDVKNGCCKKKGCYIYTNSKKTPIYIGKTDNSFGQEYFKEHKQYLINDYLKEKKHVNRCLYIFFLYFTGENRTDTYREIDALESKLIQKAYKTNSNLLNTKKITAAYNIIDDKNTMESIFSEKRRKEIV